MKRIKKESSKQTKNLNMLKTEAPDEPSAALNKG